MYKCSILLIIATSIGLILSLVLVPHLALTFVGINFLLATILAYSKLRLIHRETSDSTNSFVPRVVPPFISIHIATCNEPPQQVINAIKAAAQQQYDNFEVLVISNNTVDTDLWIPLERYCKRHNHVHFYNYEHLNGFKAGALNAARALVNPKTDLILTVDADYLLDDYALQVMSDEFINHQVDLLQFPQAYHNHRSNNGQAAEFSHYFDFYSKRASDDFKNLPTGTLSLINIRTLDAIGGWPHHSITEDAFLGIELLKNDYTIGYCHKIIGAGTMPFNMVDVKSQRMRWIFGNFQTLIYALKTTEFNVETKLLLTAQLTSWLNFNGIAWLAIIITSLFTVITPVNLAVPIIAISLLTIILHSVVQFKLFMSSDSGYRANLKAYTINVAHNLEGAYAWWAYFLNKNRPFLPTNKFLRKARVDLQQLAFNIAILSSGVLIASYLNPYLGIIVILCGAFRLFSRFYLHINLTEAREHQIANLLL